MPNLALVTGATSGIGRAFAEDLAADGHDLVVVGRREDRLAEFHAEHPDIDVQTVAADLSSDEGIAAVAEICATQPLSILINNAGVAHYMPMAELTAEQAAELVRVKVVAPTMLTRAALPGMLQRGEGTIINIAGMIAFSGPAPSSVMPRRAVYGGALAGMLATTQLFGRRAGGHADPRPGGLPGRRGDGVSFGAGHGPECGASDEPRTSSPRAGGASSWARSSPPRASRTRACSQRSSTPTWPRSVRKVRTSPVATEASEARRRPGGGLHRPGRPGVADGHRDRAGRLRLARVGAAHPRLAAPRSYVVGHTSATVEICCRPPIE